MAKKPATQSERAHMDLAAALGCIVCHNEGHGWSPAELHHPRAGMGMGQRASHMDVLPLCPNHHRNGNHGVAIHQGQKTWEKNFGTELELLEQVREMLDESMDSGRQGNDGN